MYTGVGTTQAQPFYSSIISRFFGIMRTGAEFVFVFFRHSPHQLLLGHTLHPFKPLKLTQHVVALQYTIEI
jgi:hypothetical protein